MAGRGRGVTKVKAKEGLRTILQSHTTEEAISVLLGEKGSAGVRLRWLRF